VIIQVDRYGYGKSECTLCPLGYYSNANSSVQGQGSTNCIPCPTNVICPVGSSASWIKVFDNDDDDDTDSSKSTDALYLQYSKDMQFFNELLLVNDIKMNNDDVDESSSIISSTTSNTIGDWTTIINNEFDEMVDQDQSKVIAITLSIIFGFIVFMLILLVIYHVCRKHPQWHQSTCKRCMEVADPLGTDHWIPDGTPVVKQPRALGTVMGTMIIITVIGTACMIWFTSRYTPSYTHGLADETPTFAPNGDWSVRIRLMGVTSEACTEDRHAITVLGPSTIILIGNASYGIDRQTCTMFWSCKQCRMGTNDDLSFQFELTNSWAIALETDIQLPTITSVSGTSNKVVVFDDTNDVTTTSSTSYHFSTHSIKTFVIPNVPLKQVLCDDISSSPSLTDDTTGITNIVYSATQMQIDRLDNVRFIGLHSRYSSSTLGTTCTAQTLGVVTQSAVRVRVVLPVNANTDVYTPSPLNMVTIVWGTAALLAPIVTFWTLIMKGLEFRVRLHEICRKCCCSNSSSSSGSNYRGVTMSCCRFVTTSCHKSQCCYRYCCCYFCCNCIKYHQYDIDNIDNINNMDDNGNDNISISMANPAPYSPPHSPQAIMKSKIMF
jgi:hypothetical protein